MANEFPLKSKNFHPFAELIGLNFTKVEPGYSQCTLEINEDLLNPHGVLHGGVPYSMADTGMAAALVSMLEPGKSCTTIELNIVYFRPTTSGTLICETKVVRKGRTIGFIEAEISNNDKLISKATGTFSIIDLPSKD